MATANKRIMNELAQATNNPVPGTQVHLSDDNDVYTWEVLMEAPTDSVYAPGKFHLTIALPKEYPFKPPTLSFKTKIYHPNVTNDDAGTMCLGLLRPDTWKPPNKIVDVLKLVRTILSAPQPDDAVEQGIAQQYKTDPKAFEKTAREWVVKFASKK